MLVQVNGTDSIDSKRKIQQIRCSKLRRTWVFVGDGWKMNRLITKCTVVVLLAQPFVGDFSVQLLEWNWRKLFFLQYVLCGRNNYYDTKFLRETWKVWSWVWRVYFLAPTCNSPRLLGRLGRIPRVRWRSTLFWRDNCFYFCQSL